MSLETTLTKLLMLKSYRDTTFCSWIMLFGRLLEVVSGEPGKSVSNRLHCYSDSRATMFDQLSSDLDSNISPETFDEVFNMRI